MEAFVIVALIGIGIFVFSNMKQKHSYDVADLIRPIINDWVESRDGLLDSVRFSMVDSSLAETIDQYGGSAGQGDPSAEARS